MPRLPDLLALGLAIALALGLGLARPAAAAKRGPKPGASAGTSPFGGCRVVSTTVTPGPLPNVNVLYHGGDPVQLVDSDATHFSCVDARAARNVVASPAGDIGEFLMGLQAFSDVCRDGSNLTDAEVLGQMKAFVAAHAQPLRPFYMHTADAEITKLLTKLKLDAFPKTKPANLDKWWSVLFNTTDRVHGCGHVWYQLQNPEEYHMNKDLIVSSLKAFFLLMWDPATNASMRYEVVHGAFDAWGVATVRTEIGAASKRRALRGGGCAENCEDRTPLMMPRLRPKGAPADNARDYVVSKNGMLDPTRDVFAFHATAADRFREKIVAPFFAARCGGGGGGKGKRGKPADRTKEILEHIQELAGHQLTETIHHLETSFGRVLDKFTIDLKLENAPA